MLFCTCSGKAVTSPGVDRPLPPWLPGLCSKEYDLKGCFLKKPDSLSCISGLGCPWEDWKKFPCKREIFQCLLRIAVNSLARRSQKKEFKQREELLWSIPGGLLLGNERADEFCPIVSLVVFVIIQASLDLVVKVSFVQWLVFQQLFPWRSPSFTHENSAWIRERNLLKVWKTGQKRHGGGEAGYE